MTRADPLAGLTASARTVFAEIERAADAGEPCPTNPTLTAAIGAKSVSGIPPILDRLEQRGVIEVERGAITRVVTIVATGKRTAGVVTDQHWSRRGVPLRKPRVDAAPPVRKADRPRIDRDPCPRCGTRADFGCRHSPISTSSQASALPEGGALQRASFSGALPA